jgi:Tol biopolymer transport system component
MTRTRPIAVVLAIAFTAAACGEVTAPPPLDTARYDLIFESTPSAALTQSNLFVLRDGAATRTALLGETAYASQPRVSFDGRWIAYIAPRPEDGEGAVWLARTDGTGPRQVFTTSGELLSSPAPSPDGSRIAFQATDPATGGSRIWIVNANGSGAYAITTQVHATPFVHAAPAWSPDGTQLALAAGEPGHLGVATMSAEGGPLTMRTQPASGSDTEPFWSPDGTRLLFAHTTTPAQSDIVLLTLTGGAQRTLHAGNAHHATWSPGGGLIAFSARVGSEPAELFTISPDGGTASRITTNDVSDRHPNWVRRPTI